MAHQHSGRQDAVNDEQDDAAAEEQEQDDGHRAAQRCVGCERLCRPAALQGVGRSWLVQVRDVGAPA